MSGGVGTLNIKVLSDIAEAVAGMAEVHKQARDHARGAKEEFEKAAEGIKEAFKTALELAGIGLSIEGLREMIASSIEAAEKAQNLSQVLGVTTQTIQAMTYAAGMVGGNIDTVSNALAHMEKQGELAIAGNVQAREGFRALGIDAKDLADAMKHPDEAILTIAKHVAEMADGTDKVGAIMQVFGKSSEAMIPFLTELGRNYDTIVERAKAFGVILSGEQQAALAAAGEQIDELKQAGTGLANQFTIALLPAIQAVDDVLLELGESGASGSFFAQLKNDIEETVVVVEQVVNWFGYLKSAWDGLTGASSDATNSMSHDLAGYIAQSLDEWAHIKAVALETWVGIKFAAAEQWAEIENTVKGAVYEISREIAGMLDEAKGVATATGNVELAIVFDKAERSVVNFANSIKPATVDVQKYRDEISHVETALNSEIAANAKWAEGVRLTADANNIARRGMDEFIDSLKAGDVAGNTEKLAEATRNLRDGGEELIREGADEAKVHRDVEAVIVQLTKAVDNADRARGKYNADVAGTIAAEQAEKKALSEMVQLIDSIAAKMGGGYTQAWQNYATTLEKIGQKYNDLVKAGHDHADAAKLEAQAVSLLNEEMRHSQDATAALDEVVQKATADYNERLRLSGLTVEQQKIETTYTALLSEADKALLDIMGPLTEADQKRLDLLRQLATASVHLDEAVDNSKKVFDEYRQIYTSGLDDIATEAGKFFTGQTHGFKGMFDDVLNMARNFIAQLIAQYVKLSFINPLINSMFGGMFGNLPTGNGAGFFGIPGLFASAGGGSGGTGVGGVGGTSGGGTDLFGTAQGGYSLFNAGKNIWDGFSAGWQSFFSGEDGLMMGPPTEAGSTSSYYGGGYTSGFGQALGVAGGIYAGYNRFQNRYDTGSGLAGAAAYGAGTYFAGAGLATAAATGSLAAGFAAIPVVGWIAIAAMLVDKFSGGKLFGTDANKFVKGQTDLTIGAGGATLTAGADYKGQKPLFGGSYHEWKNLPVDQAAIDAANQFFEYLTKGTENFAKQFGATMGDVVGGEFVQTFDKHGNITGSTTTIAGHTYSGESEADFEQRLIDENQLSVLGQFDSALNDTVDVYRKNVQELTDLTASLADAEMYFKNGGDLLALGSDESLSALVKLAAGAQQFGEDIGQTIERILAAQKQYDQFVGQFKKVNYVDDFEASLAQINAQYKANVKQANDLAIAAGAAGASQEDLANIQKYAADQIAAAIKALQDSAQSLAFSMGLSTHGSLDQVNSEIQRLEQQRDAASQATRDFGNAMQEAAQRAADAMNLLLGDLSPLNDVAKLQKALEGLRAGTASRDQVLEIGRRLYASSQQYTDLFNMVMSMPDHSGATSGGGHHGGGATWSGSDQQRLDELLKQQADLQKQNDYLNAQTLATQIAEIASAKKEDWHQVVQEMGIDVAGLEKKLGFNDDQFAQFIKDQQAKVDSEGNNTQSIVDAIYYIGDQITQTLGGAPSGHSQHDTTQQGDTGGGRSGVVGQPRGHSGHGGGRTMTDGDADAIGRSVGRNVGQAVRGTLPRSLRGGAVNAF